MCLLVLSLCLSSWLCHGRVSVTVRVCVCVTTEQQNDIIKSEHLVKRNNNHTHKIHSKNGPTAKSFDTKLAVYNLHGINQSSDFSDHTVK